MRLTSAYSHPNTFKSVLRITASCLAIGVIGATAAPSAMAGNSAEGSLGAVKFETSCVEQAQSSFEQGLTSLHHMMYFQAEAVFEEAAQKTPDCAMLHWGVAMSNFHPLWPGLPSEKEISTGRAAVERMQKIDNMSDRERAFVTAASAFYRVEASDYRDRIAAWSKAQKAVFDEFPEDIDAGAFFALSHLAIAPRGDKTLKHQRAAGDLLEQFHERAPNHPGLFHYAIHAYDNPPLADKALRFARGYGEIAPDVPHALHMPSHIFTRLGMWEETVDGNQRSAAAALEQPLGDMISSHYAHAMDYLIYAQLQRGAFDHAGKRLGEFLSARNQQSNFGSAYALAASPVRVLLERDKWAEAARLPIDLHPAIAWEKFPQCRSIVWFAKGIGAARSGDATIAQEALNELKKVRIELEKSKQGYWLQLTDAQVMAIEAWMEHRAGNSDAAITLLTKAADIEDAVGKSPVTPSNVLPAREQLGDMFADLGQADQAKSAYEQALSISPNRRRSLEGLTKLRASDK